MNAVRVASASALAALWIAGATAFAQAAYQPPRTPDGHPDLQGTWTNASITTLERADRYASTVLKPEEVDKATQTHPQNVRIATEDSANTPATGLLTGKDLLAGRGYNAFWIDPGSKFGIIHGETRTAWITDPPQWQDSLQRSGPEARACG